MENQLIKPRKITVFFTVFSLFFILLLDQITKCYFHSKGEGYTEVVIPDFFSLSTVYNSGSAFGFLGDASWAQIFFKILTPIVLIGLYIYFLFTRTKYTFLRFGIVFLAAGILGNFIDRISFNYVIDFISFKFGSYYFPNFNVADMAITVGIIMFFIHLLFLDKDALFARKKDKESDK